MKKSEELKKERDKFNAIISSCHGDYDRMILALQMLYKQLTNPSPDEEEELNKRYSIKELAESKVLALKKIKASHGFGLDRQFVVCPEIYLYNKAPDGMVLGLAVYDLDYNKDLPVRIDLFVKNE